MSGRTAGTYWRLRLLAVSAGLFLAVPGPVSVAQAGQSPGIAFEDARPLKLKHDSRKSLRTVKVCNVSGDEAPAPDARVSLFEKGTDAPRALMKEPDTDDKEPWKAGDCRNVMLSLEDNITLDSGSSYTGVLTVVSSMGLARRAITIDGPEEDPKPAAGKAASDPTTLKATRTWPWKTAHLNDDGALLLKAATTKEELSVPRECNKTGGSAASKGSAKSPPASTTASASDTPEPNPCPFVGNVINGTDVAKVSVAGQLKEYQTETKPAEQPASLPLNLKSADRAGTYSGALDLASTPSEPKDDVKVSVAVKDAWWCAALALLIGALLLFTSQFVLRSVWPRMGLRRRCRAFNDKYAKAIETFNTNRPTLAEFSGNRPNDPVPNPDWAPPIPTDVTDVAAEIQNGRKLYGRSTVYWDTTSEPYKELESSVALVEDDVKCLEDPTRLPATLKSLAQALKDLATFLEGKFHAQRAPRFVLPATAHLKGPAPKVEAEREPEKPAGQSAQTPPLAVGQALTITAAAQAATELIAAWRKLAERVLEYDKWWARLAKKALDDERVQKPWIDADLTKLRDAASSLAEVEQELLTVVDATELAECETAGDLKRAYTNLAYLSGVHGGWPGEAEAEAEFRLRAVTAFELTGTAFEERSKAFERGREADAGRAREQLRYWLEEAKPVGARGAAAAQLDKIAGMALALLALLFTIIVAIATGLAAFYFGNETWGTWEDYLTVIVVGVAATALVQTIVDAVSRLLPPAPKQLITGPTRALLKLPATPAAPVAPASDPE